MFFEQEQLNKIVEKIDFYEFYKEFLPDMQIRGKRAWAPCVYHSETKPSLQIDLDTGMFKCWGCQKYGNIFTFYKDFYSLSFQDAVQQLAEKYEVELTFNEEEIKKRERKQNLYKVNEFMCEKYTLQLQSDVNAWNYLTEIRGFSPKIIKEFRIGCGINSIPVKDSLKDVGLLVQGNNGDFYSKFRRDRVVFPRFDEHGNIVSFTGRLCVEKDSSKYQHTTNTEIYNKSEHIFGLYHAKKYIKNFNSVVCVEGECDMIKCYQRGICNVVALSGLNISEQQINLLKKYTSNFYICVEDDAILRSNDNNESPLDKFYSKVKEFIPYAKVYIIDLRNEDGSKCDPDMYLTNHTRDDFKELIKHAKIYNEFLIDIKLSFVNPKNIEEKTACINTLLPILANIQNFLDRRQYIELVSNKLLISENDIYRKLKFYSEKQEKIRTANLTWDSRPIYAQKILLSICFCSNFNIPKIVSYIYIKATENMDNYYKNIFLNILLPYISKFKQNETVTFNDFFNELLYNDIDEEIRKTLTDVYLKAEQLEDFTDEEAEMLVDEQIQTLKEYVITEQKIEI